MPPIAPDTAPDVNWTSHSSCTTYTDQRRLQLQTDVSELELLRDELLRSQKEAINKGLCKLNKDVKTLSIKEFNGMFGCDIVDMIRKQMEAGGVGSSSANGAKKRFRSNAGGASAVVQPAGDANGLSFKTPAVSRLGGGKPPMTTTRTARKGEVVKSYSVNGSPIEQFDNGEVFVTAKKRRGATGGVSTKTPCPISIGIGAGNGETIDLSDPGQRKNLNDGQKKQAMQQLMAIQEQMTQLMADF